MNVFVNGGEIIDVYNYVDSFYFILTDLLDRRVMADKKEEAYMPVWSKTNISKLMTCKDLNIKRSSEQLAFLINWYRCICLLFIAIWMQIMNKTYTYCKRFLVQEQINPIMTPLYTAKLDLKDNNILESHAYTYRTVICKFCWFITLQTNFKQGRNDHEIG